MKLFLDSLYFLGETLALLALAWGGWLVLRESLAGSVFPDHKEPTPDAAATDRATENAQPSVLRRARETRRAA